MIRLPAVADQFYPGDPATLFEEVRGLLGTGAVAEKALGVVAPHAGYVYSGAVAGKVYAQVEVPERVVLLGVNHRGIGAQAAIMDEGIWEMPNGGVELDSRLARELLSRCRKIKVDEAAHRHEHSLEVQVPFLQAIRPDFKLTPIAFSFLSYSDCEEIGRAVAAGIRAVGSHVLIVASSDMTHYESHESAQAKDRLALDRILALDPQGLYNTVIGKSISMCGVIPVTVTLVACKELGAVESKLVAYATSGDVTGDYRQVVGYAGVVIR